MRSFPSPHPPETLEGAGLTQALVEDLVLKHLLVLGEFRLADVAQRVKLPLSLVEEVLEGQRRENLLEVKGSANFAKTSYVFRLTDTGRRKAEESFRHCRYAGPAPVSLEEYRAMVGRQSMKGAVGAENDLRRALEGLVVNEEMIRRLGPAMTSGQAIFIHGPAGNGKTSVAEAIGRALPEQVYLPHAVAVAGEIVRVYDPACHQAVETPQSPEHDGRWVLVKRPVVNAGGELTLGMLDLTFSRVSRFYEASLQMKANNGLFILDDFGRQQSEPSQILNRWIVPLERHVDHMTLESGMRFAIPFDVLVIFSSDRDPKELVHEAFLRRLRYKIRLDRPSQAEYLEIFRKECQARGVSFSQEAYDYLERSWYGSRGVARSACHPRDLIDHIVTSCTYYGRTPQLTPETLEAACCDYFAPA